VPLIEHGPRWINFTIFTFINEKSRYFRSLHKIWNKIISFEMKKRVKCKIGHRKSEEKGEFGSFRSESLMFQRGTLIMFGLHYGTHLQLIFNYDSH
jgi:hypothetical protein